MKCRRARRMIHDFLDGLVDDRDRLQLEQHLADCRRCEREASALSSSLRLLKHLDTEKPDDNFAWNVRLRIARERRSLAEAAATDGWWGIWNRRFALGAVAACAVVVLAGYVALRPYPLTGPSSTPIATQKSIRAPERTTPPTLNVARSNFSPVLPRQVSIDDGPPADFVGPLQEDRGPALDLELLMRRYHDQKVEQYRVRKLQEQVELLTEELRACGVRCGDTANAETTPRR